MKLSHYPLDFDALVKGSWIETAELIQITGLTPDDDKWDFALLDLVQQITRQASMLARIDHGRIRIMDDQEACAYTYRQVEVGVRKNVKWAQLRALIDRKDFTDTERDLAERRDRVAAAVAMASSRTLRKQRRLEKLIVHPELGDGEEGD
jgi:hypothetical protein